MVQSRIVISRDISLDCGGGPSNPTSRRAFCKDCNFSSVGLRNKICAKRDRSLHPLINAVARRTCSKRSETRSRGQNERCSFKPSLRDSAFFISRSAHVRQRRASAGADGDWMSHFGLSSASVAPGSSKGVISVMIRPNGSFVQRYPPCRFLGRTPFSSAMRRRSLQRSIRPSGSRISS